MTKGRKNQPADFGELRVAFGILSEILRMNGRVEITRGGVKPFGIPRARWHEISLGVSRNADMVRWLMTGEGQRASVRDRQEVVLSVLATEQDGDRAFEITALAVKGRGIIENSLTVSSLDPEWQKRLRDFVDWDEISGVIAAAEGNNQRAMIGLVLQLAGIGRGRLEMIEAEVPEEVEEAAQSIKGAEWLKAGLPRFESAAGEALWYLMRIRAVHARMVRIRKQGQYTAFALGAMYASGVSMQRMAAATEMSAGLVEKLTPRPGKSNHEPANFQALGGSFLTLGRKSDPRIAMCADRVWKGAAIYVRILDRRIRVGAAARVAIGEGGDIVSTARDLGVARRDLIRILSVRQEDAIEERERFVRALIDPDLVRQAVGRIA